MTRRIIFHVDMNCFYASVEVANDPSLKGKPLAIAGSVEDRRGIVVTSSYEARARGVRTTMPVWQALKVCTELLTMRPHFDRYRSASRKIFSLLEEYTPLVEPVSIDEGYMDVTSLAQKRHPMTIAEEIQRRLMEEMDLPCSIGVAPNKFLAKMASEMKKPLGLTVLRKRELEKKLWSLSIGEMYGVGKKSVPKFHRLGIHTIGDLAKANKDELERVFGVNGPRLQRRANGIDDRPVDPDSIHQFKSVGNSTTLKEDTTAEEVIKSVLEKLARSVQGRLVKKSVCCFGVQLTIRYDNRKTISKSQVFEYPIQRKEELLQAAQNLLQRSWNGEPIRLLGITGYQLIEQQYAYRPLDLFRYKEQVKEDVLAKTVASINRRYGEDVLSRGKEHFEKAPKRNDEEGTSLDRDFLME